MRPASPQERGRRIAMNPEELDEFLDSERTCRVATSTTDGPHLTALWFVWDGASLWLYSITRSKRWRDLIGDPPSGGAGRTGEAQPDLTVPERLFARKYLGSEDMAHDDKHAWLRLTPTKSTSWDFRKIGMATDR